MKFNLGYTETGQNDYRIIVVAGVYFIVRVVRREEEIFANQCNSFLLNSTICCFTLLS